MKRRYRREAWYLDEDVLLHGHIDKRGFHPDKGLPCGFGFQGVNKKSKNKTWFYSLKKAKEILGPIETAGGRFSLAVDVGFTVTKVACSNEVCGSETKWISFDTADVVKDANNVSNEEFCNIVARCLSELGYSGVSQLNVRLMAFISEEQGNSSAYEKTADYNGDKYHMFVTYGKVRHYFFPVDKAAQVVFDVGGQTVDMIRVTKQG